jgi:PAS domain S-box-containing protein
MSKKDIDWEGHTRNSSEQSELAALHKQIVELQRRLQQEASKREQAEKEAQRREVEAGLIYEVSQRVSSELELDELFSAIVNTILDTFGYYSVILAPVDEDSGTLVIGATAGGLIEFFPMDTMVAVGEGMTGYAAFTGETQISGDVSQDPHYICLTNEPTRSELVVPLKSGTKIIGVLDLQSVEINAFDQNDVMLMETLADQIAVAMENAHLYDQAQKEIADRKRVEVELRQHQDNLEELVNERTMELSASEERYRSLFDGIPVGLYRTTPSGQILDANQALLEMYGCPTREMLLETDLAISYADPEERVRWQALMERHGVLRDFEAQIRRFDGTTFWAKDTARVVKDQHGQVLYYEGSFEDITERKLAEEELRRYQEHLEELVNERTSELRASEERYRTLFDGVPIGLYRTTPVGKVLEANLAVVQMFDFPNRDTAIETINTTELYVNPDDRARWQAMMEKEGIVRDFEMQLHRYDGELVWLSDSARAVKDEDGNVLYYEGSLEDITERKGVEQELRRQKDYFEALFSNSPVAIVTADMDANVVSWNPRAETLFGYSFEEALGRNLDSLVASDPSIRQEGLSLTEKVKRMNRVQLTSKRNRKDGSLVDVDILVLPLILAGEKAGFYVMYHDVSDLKNVERELRRQKNYFESLFINSPIAIMTSDLQSKVVTWNPMAEKMFGYRQEEAIGRFVDDLVATDPNIREQAELYTRELLATERIQVTAKRTRKDGTLVDVEVLAMPAIVDGEKVGYIGIYYDISELLQARREAEAANQAKSIFLANMSHELRTPLNAILGFTQLMDGDSNLTSGQQENLKIINQSGEHLLALVNDVLDMSKIEAGQVKLRQKPFDLYQLMDSLEEIFRFQTEKKGLDLDFQVAGEVPRFVISDEGKLRQVLNNLIGNALKFTRQGGIRLQFSATPVGSAKNELHFDVYDTGPGIAPEDMEAVFDPFVQAASTSDSQATQTPEGTGLGLSISRRFARLMGGDITVSSKYGEGSHFSFYMSAGIPEFEEVLEAAPKRDVIGLEPDQPVYRILVVEDRETNRRFLVKLLQQAGFEVQEAANGQEALDCWVSWQPHLIWMDMRMPVMNGREATRRIKSMPGGESVAIIALTATAFDEEREQIMMDGCDDFVCKPFRVEEIFEMLEKHLKVRFIYEKETIPAAEAERLERSSSSECAEILANQSPKWIDELQQATQRADMFRILELIEQIRDQDPELARLLTEYSERYEYQEILDLIDQAGG